MMFNFKTKKMFITLEKKDYQVIATAIAQYESIDEKDISTATVEINGVEFNVRFSREIAYSREDDYENGTGAVNVEDCDVYIYNIELAADSEVAVSYEGTRIAIMAEEKIKLN